MTAAPDDAGTRAVRSRPTGTAARAGVRAVPASASGLFVAAGALALVSLGLPWGASSGGYSFVISGFNWFGMPDPYGGFTPMVVGGPVRVDVGSGEGSVHTFVGAQHPVRVIGLVAALLLVTAVRQGLPGRARAAIALGALALPLQLAGGLTSGRVTFAAALVLAAMGAGVLPRLRSAGRRSVRGQDDVAASG